MTTTPDLFETVTLTELLQRQQMIRVTQIRADGGTQMRAQLDPATVDDYRGILYRQERTLNWPFPPLTVFYDGSDYWLADGFHRLAAFVELFHIANNPDVTHTLPCLVHPGTRRDAILYAAAANSDHGLRRTNADKRRAVETLLRDEEWRQWSDHEIARRCEVSQAFVTKVRAALTDNGYQSPEHRIGADGRTINTAKIGQTQPRREPKPRPARPLPEPSPATVVYDPGSPQGAEPPAEPEPTPATLDDLPLVEAEEFPGPTDAEREDRRHTYAWLRTIYQEARDATRMYEEMTGDFASRGPLLRTLEPMLAALDRYLAVYETTQEELL